MTKSGCEVEKNPIQIKSEIIMEDDKHYIVRSSDAELSLKIDVKSSEQIVKTEQPLLGSSYSQEILDELKLQENLADLNMDIKLENIKSFDYGVGEIHIKQELDDVKVENEKFIVKSEASFHCRAEEFHIKKELDVKFENEGLIDKNQSDDEIDLIKTEFGSHTIDSLEQPAQVMEFTCRRHFQRHILAHKDLYNVKMFKCNDCSYQAKQKVPSEIEMFKCIVCGYECKRKSTLDRHMLVHKDPSQVKMFECNECDYRSNRKSNLKLHMLVHGEPSQVKRFKCEKCSYRFKQKSQVKQHMLVHKDPSEVEMFKCAVCEFQCKNKHNLKRHTLIHEDPSNVDIFQCSKCDYRSKREGDIKRHILIHEDPSQVFRCDNCNYRCKQKYSLKKHMRVHAADETGIQ